MEVHERDVERLATAHPRGEGPPRFRQKGRLGVAKVDQVAVVGEDLGGTVPEAPAVFPEGLDLLFRQGLDVPSSLVPGKEGKGSCSDFRGVFRRLVKAARCTDVGAHGFHCSHPLFKEGFPS